MRACWFSAGGGLELKALAEAHAGWTFVGVDPAMEMLNLAERMLGPLNARVTLRQGYIDDVSETGFDAAVCLLTLHFLAADERRRTEAEIRRRLKSGAPFVAAHSSFPQADWRSACGCRAMRRSLWRRGSIRNWRRAHARMSMPSCSRLRRNRIKRYWKRLVFRMSRSSTRPSRGGDGWATRSGRNAKPAIAEDWGRPLISAKLVEAQDFGAFRGRRASRRRPLRQLRLRAWRVLVRVDGGCGSRDAASLSATVACASARLLRRRARNLGAASPI